MNQKKLEEFQQSVEEMRSELAKGWFNYLILNSYKDVVLYLYLRRSRMYVERIWFNG